MDNSTPGVTEKVGGRGLSNGPSFRRPGGTRPVSSTSLLEGGSSGPNHLPHTIITVYSDEKGYGMKVSGDNPVYVQSVKEGGAAERAGLHSGDKIIKVNGVNVTHSTHTEVVDLIRAGPQVVLTVQQRPVHSPRPSNASMASPGQPSRPLQHHHSAPARDRITGPKPVDHKKQVEIENERLQIVKVMLEHEQNYVEALRSSLARCTDPAQEETYVSKLSGAERRVQTLQQQIIALTSNAPEKEAGSGGSTLGMHTHQRTKSSPDTLSSTMSLAEASKRLISSESMSELSVGAKRPKGGVAWDVDSPHPTPPGTPPPPYGSTNAQTEELSELLPDDTDTIRGEHQPTGDVGVDTSPSRGGGPPVSPIAGANFVQPPIISMEDDDMSDQEVSHLEDHGPFKSLSKLWSHHAHLAVFLNYVISNSDPSSLLFYLITDLYKEGNAKEMKKWAYEIHSSFLVPCAPLRLNNVDENVAREIDDVLLNESDKEEILRRIFWKARQKAKEELNEQLADFQQKRTAGLGTIFGPPDAELDGSINDKSKEMRIVETILVPKMEPYLEDVEKEIIDGKRFTTAAALGTVMGKLFGIRGQQFSSLMERCPTFVSKEKSLKSKIIGKTRKVTLKGHHFLVHQYYTVTYCNHCQLIIWGIGPQGYQCSNCLLNIHRHCIKVLDENCPGPMFKKEKGNDRISKFMEKIRPENTRRKPSTLNLAQVERVKRLQEEQDGALTDSESGDRPVSAGRIERRPDPVRETEEKIGSSAHNETEDDSHSHHELTHVTKSKPLTTSINRSESYKERIHNKRQLRERRKTSDPNLSKTNNDVDLDSQNLSSYHANSGSSSNSSLSTRSLDSPSNSLEAVSGGRTCSESVPSNGGGIGGTTPQWDSDAEAEPDPPDWTRNVPEEVLNKLSPSEKKRQEVVNELFHTERSHVRGLKVIDQVFYRPMKELQILPPDQIQLLFANLEEMLVIHSQFNNSMKTKRKESPVVGDIGDLLLDMFDGAEGETFQRAAATFCARQQIALEALKERRKKDAKLHNFLTDAEGNPMCRRLQLKDIIPTGMLRLTKYPLLFESLAKYTPSGTEEAVNVLRAVERSKEILNYVDKAVKEAEDQHRLAEIQRRLDKTLFDKADNPLANEFKNLDLTKHRLIHEGALVWRMTNRPKPIDLHVLLLEDVIILLQKQDEKFILKFYSTNLSPVIKVSTVLVRPNAVDKTALFLVNTSQNGAQIYDLVATSSSEKKKWFKHISDAAEAYKQRDGRNRRADAAAAAAAAQHELDAADQDKTKDSEEATHPSDLLSPPRATNGPENDSPSPNSDATPFPSGESTPQASPSPSTTLPDTPEPVTRKLGDGLSPSPSLGRKAAEPLRLTTTENPLIEPSEVLVSQRPVLTAEPVLTPLEKLRRKDEAIRQALAEKQQLVADILHIPREEFETIAELAGEPSTDKEASELVLAAVNQANQLSAVVNEALRVTEEEAVSAGAADPFTRCNRLPGISPHRLQSIASSLNTQLTQLLNIMAERDEERERLRRELQRSREQLHAMHERQDHVLEPSAELENTTGTTTTTTEVELSVPEQQVVQCVVTQEVFVDALSGEAESHLEAAAAVSTAQLDDQQDIVE